MHYRCSGRGPAVLLLHDCPNSSRLMVPRMVRLAARGLTAIAPDLPGYGLSDGLSGDPAAVTLDRVAARLHRFCEVLGLRRVGVYGFHTGAVLAALLAGMRPEAIAACVLDGYPIFSLEERADFLAGYLPPFEPSWDGAHLVWLWARLRQQTIFFPWNRASRAHRMDYDMPSPEATQASMDDFLRAGDGYRVVYGGVFRMDCASTLTTLKVPTLVCAAARDPLAAHLLRLPEGLAATLEVEPPGAPEEVLDRAVEWLAAHPGEAPGAPAAPTSGPGLRQTFLGAAGGQSHALIADGSGRPILLLHGAGESSRTMRGLAQALSEQRPVLALSLPGHGESDPHEAGGALSIERWAESAARVLEGLGAGAVDVVGHQAGGQVALALAARRPQLVHRLAVRAPLVVPPEEREEMIAHYAPSIAPRWDGGHVLTAWHFTRLKALFRPWYRPKRSAILWSAPDPDTRRIHLEVCELLKAGDRHVEAHASSFAFMTEEAVAACKAPLMLAHPQGEPPTEAASGAVALPNDDRAAAAALLAFLAP